MTKSRRKEDRENGIFSDKVVRTNFIGCYMPKKQKRSKDQPDPKRTKGARYAATHREKYAKPNLLYQVVEHQSKCNIENILQVACCILGINNDFGSSKKIIIA